MFRRDSRQRACLNADLSSVRRAPTGELGTPARFWVDTHLPALIRQCAGDRAVRVLDLGCHDGAYLGALRAIGVRGSYVGVDIAPSPAWSTYPAEGILAAEFRVHDAHEIAALEPRGFDLVMAITTFEHFADDEKVLDGVASQLVPGGAFLLVVPSEASFLLYGPHGFRRYSAPGTRKRLEEAGLVVEQVLAAGGLASFMWHASWFQASRAVALAGKAALTALAGFDRSRRKRLFGSLDSALNSTQFWHQELAVGRALHARLNRATASLDSHLPVLPALHAFVARKPV